MFKRICSFVIAILLLFSVAGCRNVHNDQTEPSAPEPTSPTAESPTENATEGSENEEGQGIQVDEDLLSVEITLPASFFEGEDLSVFDFDAYVQEQGFISANANDDGSVTATMTKRRYKELVAETRASIEEGFASFIGPDTPYIKDITHNDDFTQVTMSVNRAEYENAFDFTPFAIGIVVALYQQIAQIDYYVEVSVVDADTGDLIKNVVYPDAFGG